MSTILIVDDDGETCRFMAELLGRPDREIRTTQHVAEALTLARQSFDLLISDINLDAQQNGMDVLRAFKQGNPRGHVVLISGFGTLQTAIDAVRAGAFDYISKPFNITEVKPLLNGRSPMSGAPRPSLDVPPLVSSGGQPACWQFTSRSRTRRCGRAGAIIGDSGTGKRVRGRFMRTDGVHPVRCPINCGALTESVARIRALWTHRGSFTGAIADTKASSDKPPAAPSSSTRLTTSAALQVKLLRVLQKASQSRSGSRQIKVDMRGCRRDECGPRA
jgi:DNA-binding NtrC family response regulator